MHTRMNLQAAMETARFTVDSNFNIGCKILIENRVPPEVREQLSGTLVTIERKDVGVTLELTPQVLENDLIRLEIKQEILRGNLTGVDETAVGSHGDAVERRSHAA